LHQFLHSLNKKLKLDIKVANKNQILTFSVPNQKQVIFFTNNYQFPLRYVIELPQYFIFNSSTPNQTKIEEKGIIQPSETKSVEVIYNVVLIPEEKVDKIYFYLKNEETGATGKNRVKFKTIKSSPSLLSFIPLILGMWFINGIYYLFPSITLSLILFIIICYMQYLYYPFNYLDKFLNDRRNRKYFLKKKT